MSTNNKLAAPVPRIFHLAPSLEVLPELEENCPENGKLAKPQIIDRTFQGRESILSSMISLCVEETKPNIPDGGWGWFVVLAAFYINMVSEGIIFTFGLLYIVFLNEFGASKSATSWIGSLFMAVPLLSGVMYVTFGVIGGLGKGLTYVTAVVSLAFLVREKRTFVLGLAASGAGFGTIVFSPLSTFLLFEFGGGVRC
ncbi:hypothetical protein NQ314_018163 [Rhamnusium bicolor]|uniref:Uncharacterized protein n=1 Tax=Rhamnusium bicolor TaxID=1586634 RepID=A0AAV8WRN2_9CUCU|nr:hypothetical protein NQ314_018163 [Rhamnusium bicolor]